MYVGKGVVAFTSVRHRAQGWWGGWGRRGEGRLPLSSTDEQRPVWSCPRSCRRRPHHSHPVSMYPSLPHPHSTTRPSVCVLPTNPTHNTTHGNESFYCPRSTIIAQNHSLRLQHTSEKKPPKHRRFTNGIFTIDVS